MDTTDDTSRDGLRPTLVPNGLQSAHRTYAPLNQIEGYWETLRGTRMMPQRSEIDPRGLKGTLEYCFVLERIAPGLARMRVAGTHLTDLMGMEVRGMPISAYLTAEARQGFAEAMEEVFETPAKATFTLSAVTSLGRPPMQAKMVIMPVRSDLGDVSRALGGIMTHDEIGRVPRRFNVEGVRMTPVTGRDMGNISTPFKLAPDAFRSAEAQRLADQPRQRPASGTVSLPPLPETENTAPTRSGMAEAPEDFRQALPGIPYLRVVD